MNVLAGLIVLRHGYMIHVAAVAATVIGSLTNKPRLNKNKFEYIYELMPFGMSLYINNSHKHQGNSTLAFLESIPSSSP